MNLIPWLVFAHVLGAFLFVLAHGVSVFVVFRVRREREPARIAALLDLSAAALGLAFVGLLLLLVAGIVTGIVKSSFGQGWIWASIVVLVAVGAAMNPLGTQHYGRIRGALSVPDGDEDVSGHAVASAVAPERLSDLLENRRPEVLAVVGGGGFLVILWLMMFRPF
jgi:phosphotransferase system  glucose/maltose/N-acetylglucosamine-specific IIC component